MLKKFGVTGIRAPNGFGEVQGLAGLVEADRHGLRRRVDDERREATIFVVGEVLHVELAAVRARVGRRRCAGLLALGRAACERVGTLLHDRSGAGLNDGAPIEGALEPTIAGIGFRRRRRRRDELRLLDERITIAGACPSDCDDREAGHRKGHGGGETSRHGSTTSVGTKLLPRFSPLPSCP